MICVAEKLNLTRWGGGEKKESWRHEPDRMDGQVDNKGYTVCSKIIWSIIKFRIGNKKRDEDMAANMLLLTFLTNKNLLIGRNTHFVEGNSGFVDGSRVNVN